MATHQSDLGRRELQWRLVSDRLAGALRVLFSAAAKDGWPDGWGLVRERTLEAFEAWQLAHREPRNLTADAMRDAPPPPWPD